MASFKMFKLDNRTKKYSVLAKRRKIIPIENKHKKKLILKKHKITSRIKLTSHQSNGSYIYKYSSAEFNFLSSSNTHFL